jgi:hypothetical protein
MSYYPDHITWLGDNATADEELQAAMEPFEEHDHAYNFDSTACEFCGEPREEHNHEYVGGHCLDCDDVDADFDPTPYGVLIDNVDALSYRGLVKP